MSEELHIETQKLFRELFFKQEYTSKFGGGVKLVPKTDPASVKLRGDFYTKLLDEQAFRKGLRRRGKLPSPDTIDGLKKYFYPNNGQYNNYNLDTGLIHFIIIAGDIDNPEIIEELWDTIYKVLLRLREEIMNKRDNRGPVDDRTRPGENIRRELGVRAPDRPAPKSMTELEKDDDDDADMNEIIRGMRKARLDSKRTSAVAPGLGDLAESGGRRRKSRRRKSRKSSNKKRKQRKTKRRRQ